MRPIKFRAWDEEAKYMVCWELILEDGIDKYLDIPLMQYTGLKDKNGKEIYEGDLLRIPAESVYEETTFNCFEVFYHDNECIGGQNIGFCINRMHTQGHSGGGRGYKFTPESIKSNGFVVCGNIHENPELLEVKDG